MSYMMKTKRYKFGVQCCLEELTQVPFVSAVLFAKIRLVDGGNFQDHSSREEVRDHAVRWNAKFSFVCKMYANANTGVLEKARMRVSVRRECKGGRSYQKLGFCDVNLAELAGAGETSRCCLLEGYDAGHRQDNSMLRMTIKMNMISGDPLFKVPERKKEATEVKGGGDSGSESAAGGGGGVDDDCASSTASSDFGSLTKKKNFEGGHLQLASYELPTPESEELPPVLDYPDVTVSAASGGGGTVVGASCISCQQQTHSRNSSNTSGDMSSKASGYGSSMSAASAHSRQSSEGDCDANPRHHNSVRLERTTTTTTTLYIPTKHTGRASLSKLLLEKTVLSESSDVYYTPNTSCTTPPDVIPLNDVQSPPIEAYKTPETTLIKNKSFAMPTYFDKKKKTVSSIITAAVQPLANFQIFKQKSLNTIPALLEKNKKNEEIFNNFPFLTPLANRKNSLLPATSRLPGCLEDDLCLIPSDLDGDVVDGMEGRHKFKSLSNEALNEEAFTSTPKENSRGIIQRNHYHSERSQRPHTLALALGTNYTAKVRRLEGVGAGGAECTWCGGLLEPHAGPPSAGTGSLPRRLSSSLNPSSGSLTTSASESGSLERARAALERRKLNPQPTVTPSPPSPPPLPLPLVPPLPPQEPPSDSQHVVSCRVENTRVNPDSLIDELLAATDLKRAAEDSAETSGLQLFIASDGTAEVGSRQRQQLARRDLQRVVVKPTDHR